MVLVLMALLPAAGCGTDALDVPPAPTGSSQADGGVQHTVGFVGYVYDGALGSRLTSYTIEAMTRDAIIEGTVSEDGRYLVGDISVWDDFTIVITASGYRSFVSHNAQVGVPPELDGSDDIGDLYTSQTLHYDAYLFPTDLEAPEATLTVTTPVVGEVVSGKMRLRPTTRSELADELAETPAGVPGQVWENDEDLQADAVTKNFTTGSVTISEGELVYGVSYQVSIYDVDGYQPFQGVLLAGQEVEKTFELTPVAYEPLEVLSDDIADCTPPSSPYESSAAEVTITFNYEVECGEGYDDGCEEALDDSLAISSPNDDGDEDVNELRADLSPSQQERATSISFDGEAIALSWDPSAGLADQDPDDPFVSVTYGGGAVNLSQVFIQRVGMPLSVQPLSELIGSATITCSQ